MKRKSIFVLLIAIMLMLSSCSGKIYMTADEKYSIEIPGSWKGFEGELNPGALIELGDESKDRYMIVLSESAEAYASFDEYATVAMYQLGGVIREAVMEATEIREVDSHRAYMTKYSGIMGNRQVSCVVYFADFEDEYIQIIAWTKHSSFSESCEAQLQKIAESFKVNA